MRDQYGFERMRLDKVSRASVIRVDATVGDGSEEDPTRRVVLFFDDDGRLVASHDPWHDPFAAAPFSVLHVLSDDPRRA